MQMEHGWNLLQHVCVLKGRSLDPYHTFPRVFPHAPRPKIFRYFPKVTKEAPYQGKANQGFFTCGKNGWKCSRPCRSHLAPHTGSAVPEDVG